LCDGLKRSRASIRSFTRSTGMRYSRA
jgi:hypothetical protein